MNIEGNYFIQNYGNVVDYVQAITQPERLEDFVCTGTYLRERVDIHEINDEIKDEHERGTKKYRMHFCTPMSSQLCRTIEFALDERFKDLTLDGRSCESTVYHISTNTLMYVQEVTNSQQELYTLFEGFGKGKNMAITLTSSDPGNASAVQYYIHRPSVNIQLCLCEENSRPHSTVD